MNNFLKDTVLNDFYVVLSSKTDVEPKNHRTYRKVSFVSQRSVKVNYFKPLSIFNGRIAIR